MSAKQKKVIVTCAVTGAIHTPRCHPTYLVTPKEIEDAAVWSLLKAGASIVHLHARHQSQDSLYQTPEAFMEFLPNIKASLIMLSLISQLVVHRQWLLRSRLQPAFKTLKPEVASLNMGSMNFGLYPMLKSL
jgi:uncharacterized protein (DUF849 family)